MLTYSDKRNAANVYLVNQYLEAVTMAAEIRDAFVSGSEYTEAHYKCEIDILKQRIENLTSQIGEIIGGVLQGTYQIKN